MAYCELAAATKAMHHLRDTQTTIADPDPDTPQARRFQGRDQGGGTDTGAGTGTGRPGSEKGKGKGTVCTFMSTPKGCTAGGKCKFHHPYIEAGDKRCFNCGAADHMMKDCTRPRKYKTGPGGRTRAQARWMQQIREEVKAEVSSALEQELQEEGTTRHQAEPRHP